MTQRDRPTRERRAEHLHRPSLSPSDRVLCPLSHPSWGPTFLNDGPSAGSLYGEPLTPLTLRREARHEPSMLSFATPSRHC